MIDKNGTGYLYINDLKKLCKGIRKPLTDTQFQTVIDKCNIVKGQVQYEEFVQNLLYS